MVTDYDSWKEEEAHVTVEMVLEYLRRNADLAKRIIRETVPRIPAAPGCSCHRALQNTILTPPNRGPRKPSAASAPFSSPTSKGSRRGATP